MKWVPGELLASGLVEIDGDGLVVDANAIFLDWAGTHLDDVIGSPLSSLVGEAEPTPLASEEYLADLAEIRNDAGSKLSVFVAHGEPDERGHRLVTIFDATTQRSFREQLFRRHSLIERTKKRLELVIAASIAFSETESESKLAEVLASTTAQAYAAEESVVFFLDEHNGFQKTAGTNPLTIEADLHFLADRAMNLRDVVKISGPEEAAVISPVLQSAFERASVEAMIIAPMHQGDQPLGLVAAFFLHPREFDDQASPLADALAGQASRALSALRLRAQIEDAATHDDITGLPNRRLLEEWMDRSTTRSGVRSGVVFVDLDGFKNVNDQLGHHIGDAVLREVGARLAGIVGTRDTIARYGGDEFVIVCEDTDKASVLDIAETVRERLGVPYEALAPSSLRISASIGVALGQIGATSEETAQLVRAADQAMYRAKHLGGNRIMRAR